MEQAKEIITTADGSASVRIRGTSVTYHSHFGALAESRHIFIHSGLQQLLAHREYSIVRVLEIGFGTGLNALLTAIFAATEKQNIHYTGLEPHPLPAEIWSQLKYGEQLDQAILFRELQDVPWEQDIPVHSHFTLHKKQSGLPGTLLSRSDLVYFDAFGPGDQPELWTEEVFRGVYTAMVPGAILVTYCAKGAVRRLMQDMGFITERLPGPPGGKREILRARKPE